MYVNILISEKPPTLLEQDSVARKIYFVCVYY